MKTWLLSTRDAGVLAVLFCSLSSALAGSAQLVSAPSPALPPAAGGSGDSGAPVLSPDGRFVLFASAANNLASLGGSNTWPAILPGKLNVFLRDRVTGTTTLVSPNLSGTAGGNGDSLPLAVSTNGRYALFESSASDLVPGDTNLVSDLFVRDLEAETTIPVSVATNGGMGNGLSQGAVMTPDGRYVAFVSYANNLVPGDANGLADVFVRDLQTGVTTLASVGAVIRYGSTVATGSFSPEITPNGRYVAFFSTATNLVPGVPCIGDIYVRDLVAGTTLWASSGARDAVQAITGQTNTTCFNHAISDDGQVVAYEARLGTNAAGLILRYNVQSGPTDVVHTNAAVPFGSPQDLSSLAMTPDGWSIAFVANGPGVPGQTTCVLVWNALAGATMLASGDPAGTVPTNSTCQWPGIDTTGRYVSFRSNVSNLVAGVTGDHIYVRDLQAAATKLVDLDTNGLPAGISPATVPVLSANGQHVAFEALDANLVANDRNRSHDVFLRDLSAGTTELVSAIDPTLPCLTPNGSSAPAAFSVSADGRWMVFTSEADDLVAGDTNGCSDVFLRDLQAGANSLVSVGFNGSSANDFSLEPSLSADGRYVAFTSAANNLVPGDTNGLQDVFLRDLQTGATTLISIGPDGAAPGNTNSYSPVLSANGRCVLFRSRATNLAPGTFTAGSENLFLRDLPAAKTYALTTAGGVLLSAMTPDGRYVAYGAAAGNTLTLYVWDLQAAGTVYSKVFPGASSPNALAIRPDGQRLAYATNQVYALDWTTDSTSAIGPAGSLNRPAMKFSADGRFLVYVSRTALSASANTNQIYLYDFQTGSNLLVSHAFSGTAPAAGNSDSPDLSPDGRFVAYRSAAPNILPGVSDGRPMIFVYDRLSGATLLASAAGQGSAAANNRALAPVFSGDGRTLLFQSWASDLVAQDFNRSADLFAVGLYTSSSIPLFSVQIVPGRQPTLTWPAYPGASYHVQFKNSLADADWQDAGSGAAIVGSQGYFTESADAPAQRFYRIIAY